MYAGADNNVWILTTAVPANGNGRIYDVMNRRGELIDRIQVPLRRQLVGFGKGGVVYFFAFEPGQGS